MEFLRCVGVEGVVEGVELEEDIFFNDESLAP